jgi:hypothetical protein
VSGRYPVAVSRPPFWEFLTPGQMFGVFVGFCSIGIIGTVLMIAFFPWSIPFWMIAMFLLGWGVTRFLTGLGPN